MILPFKEQFVSPILKGTKIHTIREDKPNRWRTGKLIHLATGVRTKNYNCFATFRCESIQKIEIIRSSDNLETSIVKVDDRILSELEVQRLAYSDGFTFLVEFWLWFEKGFEGKIIHWTDKKY